MIRSLFDTEDEERAGEKSENKIAESPKTESRAEPEIAGIVESTQLEPAQTSEIPPVSDESAAPLETVREEVLGKPRAESPAHPQPETSLPLDSETVDKDMESGSSSLGLEKEIAKIEEEVRLESQAEIEVETNAEDKQFENQALTENESAPEKEKSAQSEPGIFTAAINKAQREKQTSSTLESLLIMPQEERADSAAPETESPNPAGAAAANETRGFILPNRAAPKPENAFLTQSETPQIDYKPESKAAIIRKSGLAWTAGIVFFGSVVFLLILGWFADLLLGTSPWGAVGGVILGSIIGFIQFFRITSQILKDDEEMRQP